MIRTIDLTTHSQDYRTALPRAELAIEQALAVVQPICQDVAEQGIAALQHYCQKFDQVLPPSFRVPEKIRQRCLTELDPKLRAAFETAIQRRRLVCEQLEQEKSWQSLELAPGAVIHQAAIAVERVGLYVPGGLAPLASSVIMNVVPAQIAGVSSIVLASPPQPTFNGWPHPNILALAELLGVNEVIAVGGAQAIAMFAHGVPEVCEPVNLVTGPGNIYVVAAKRLLKGLVGIDSEAGPTEIAILADNSANPRYVAADLISQAEHDPAAASVLVTDCVALSQQVKAELNVQVNTAIHRDRISKALGGSQSAIVLVKDLEQGIEVVNAYGAEHLEIHTQDAAGVARSIRNAGAIFIGEHSPVSLGDYAAGSTHVLPTAGCACHSSGLNVSSFMKKVHVIDYSAEALSQLADQIELFALAENLPAHANAIRVRRAK